MVRLNTLSSRKVNDAALASLGDAWAIDPIEPQPHANIPGTGGDDNLFDTAGDDVIDAMGGNDSITVTLGDDDVFGGSGNDTLIVDWGSATTRVYNFRAPTVNGPLGGFDGEIYGGNPSYDVTYSSIENFRITTGSGNDEISTASGDDVVSTGAGDDSVNLGTGATGSADGGSNADLSRGVDRLAADLSAVSGAVTWNLVTNSFSGPAGFTFTNFEVLGVGDNDTTRFRTGSGNDVLVTTSLDERDFIDVGGGNDIVTVSRGYDVVLGGTGTDTLIVDWASATTRIYNFRAPIANGPLGGFDGEIYGGNPSYDVIYSSIENFRITTGSGNDEIGTASGDDVVSTGAGDDSVNLGAGASGSADGGNNADLSRGVDRLAADLSTVSGAVTWNLVTNSFSGPAGFSFTNFEALGVGDSDAGRFRTGSGNDVLVTTSLDERDFIDAGGGNDIVTVSRGYDVVLGGTGSDTLIVDWASATTRIYNFRAPTANAVTGGFNGEIYGGNPSYDVLYDSIENFRITTGSGNDEIGTASGDDVVSTGAGDDTLNAGAGNDILDAGTGQDTANGGADRDRLIVDYSSSGDSVVTSALTGDLAAGYTGTIQRIANSALRVNFTGIEDFTVTGSAFDDNITVGNGNDVVNLGNGDDFVDFGAGNDSGDGGIGIDGFSADLSGTDTATNINLVTGVSATFTNFEYLGTLTTGSGNDVIVTRAIQRNETINTGAGADTITVAGGDDIVNGGADRDRLIVDYSGSGDSVVTSALSGDLATGYAGTIQRAANSALRVTFTGIEDFTVTGSAFDDNIVVGNGNDILNGGGGIDTLNGAGGNDQIDGGTGADTMIGGLGNDIYFVDNAGDVVTEAAGEGIADEIRTTLADTTIQANVETLTYVGAGSGTLRGNAANNSLIGGSGADLFYLNTGGTDTATGGGGNDGFYFGAAYTAADIVNGGAGVYDSIGLQGDYSAGVTLGSMVGTELVVLLAGDDARFGGQTGTNLSYNITANAVTEVSNNRLTLQANSLRAGENFTFDGSASAIDFLVYGGFGTETLTGGAGNDGFFFGQGRFGSSDAVNGGAGTMDQLGLQGNYAGANAVTFGAGQMSNVEFLVLLSAADNRFGSSGGTAAYDLTMNDNNVSSGQRIIVSANTLAASETLSFRGAGETNGSFQIFAGAGNDFISGSQTADDLWGGAGNDTIEGQNGADTLRGGLGNDTFAYLQASHSTNAARDQILDFASGDLIDLGGLRANTGGGAFTFVGGNGQTGARQVQVLQNGSAATVNVFIDADAVADLVIDLTVIDGHTLTSADFGGISNAGQAGPTGFADHVAALQSPVFDDAVIGHAKYGFDGLAADVSLPDHLLVGRFDDLRHAGATHDFVL